MNRKIVLFSGNAPRTFSKISSQKSKFTAAVLLLALAKPWTAPAQTAPVIVSATPTNGATAVATNSNIVIVFDQDMKTTVTPIVSFPGAIVGNFEIQPTNLVANVAGSWGADKRTLTLRRSIGWPYSTIINWTLNPPTNASLYNFPQFVSASNVPLATVSGSFTTVPPPPPPPKLASVTPTDKTTEVSPNSAIVFLFDKDMDTSIVPTFSQFYSGGNFTVVPYSFSNAFWGADKRTLTIYSTTPTPPGTGVSWTLNPGSFTNPFTSAQDIVMGSTNGSFIILTNTGGNPNEICQIQTDGTTNGLFSMTKTLQEQRQVSASDFVPVSGSYASFILFAENPPGPAKKSVNPYDVTNGSLTLPNNSVIVFTNSMTIITNLRGGGFITNYGPLGIYFSNKTDVEVESSFPPGNYTMRLDQAADPPESVIPMNLAVSPAVPTILNYDQAQTINPTQDFTLNWNALTSGTGAFLSLTITDEFGKLIFAAPNPCVPRTLVSTATSILIPANTFRPGVIYKGTLLFGYKFYDATNDAPQMVGTGLVSRATTFQLKTSGGSGADIPLPAMFTLEKLPPSRKPELTLHGPPGKTYTIQRSSSLTSPDWTSVGSVLTDLSGDAVFDETNSPVQFPAFYRAVGD